jgi:hypothetical protein
MVADAIASGSPSAAKPSTKVPFRSASISVGTNGADAGIVNTQGKPMVMQSV